MASFTERVLILCKTYPSPSAKYAETSCVAGMTEDGRLIRLYPVPFRLVATASPVASISMNELSEDFSLADARALTFKAAEIIWFSICKVDGS